MKLEELSDMIKSAHKEHIENIAHSIKVSDEKHTIEYDENIKPMHVKLVVCKSDYDAAVKLNETTKE